MNTARKVIYFVPDQKTDQTPVLFDMPRNTSVQRRNSSAALIRMSGLYYNPKKFHLKFINRLPISGPNLKVTSKTKPSKNFSLNFCNPPFR
jgi:hypothetical protein